MPVTLAPNPIDQPSPRGGVLRAARRPAGWVALGPPPQLPKDLAELWPSSDEDLCWLAGNWRILQRLDGHRTSLDDLLTAHLAASLVAENPPARCLDLGCGIGSVLLFLAWRFPSARLVGVEAQAVSAGLAARSLAWNGISARAEIQVRDFREPGCDGARGEASGTRDRPHALPTPRAFGPRPRRREPAREGAENLSGFPHDGTFDLVTGTPPYFPVGAGPESNRIQRGPCRFEHRGGIEAYCVAAALRLAHGAPFVACEAWNQRERVEPAARAAGLRLVRWREIVPRAGKEPLVCIFAMRQLEVAEPLVVDPPLVVRDERGRRTAEFVAIRAAMGMPG